MTMRCPNSFGVPAGQMDHFLTTKSRQRSKLLTTQERRHVVLKRLLTGNARRAPDVDETTWNAVDDVIRHRRRGKEIG